MFNKLIASQGARRGFWSARTVSVSVGVHILLLAGAVYASVAAPDAAAKVEEEVTFMEIEEQEPEAPQAEEPPPPPSAETPVVPPPPKGFQELIPPDQPPPAIPDVDTSQPAVSAADFSGVGQAGGTATGVEGGTPQNAAAVDSSNFAYEVAALDAPPRLSNIAQVQSALQRLYPPMLQDAGIEGTVMMQFVIGPDGKVDPGTVQVVSSTHEQFASASVRAVERFRFRPGKYKGEPVRVLIQMPIAWKPQR